MSRLVRARAASLGLVAALGFLLLVSLIAVKLFRHWLTLSTPICHSVRLSYV